MAKKAKIVFTLPVAQETSAPALCAALNRKFGAAGFSFTQLPPAVDATNPNVEPEMVIGIAADGPWHKPGNERPTHGTMNAYAEGYAAALDDVRPRLVNPRA